MSKFLPFNLFVRQALLYPLTAPFLPPINKVLYGISYAAGLLTGTYVCPQAFGLPKTGQTTKYRDGDDGDFEKGFPIAPPRFVDNGDGTITDKATGLMWAKDGNGVGCNNGNTLLWAAAIDWGVGLSFAGYSDWRLPNMKELLSIITYGRHSPCLDPTYFTNTKSDEYWSSTTRIKTSTYAFRVHFSEGKTYYANKATTNHYVRAVRLGIGS